MGVIENTPRQDRPGPSNSESELPRIQPHARRRLQPGEGSSGMTTRAQQRRIEDRWGQDAQDDYHDPDAAEERAADRPHEDNPGRQAQLEEQQADVPLEQANDPDIDPMRAPNGPGIHGANAAKDYPMVQRAMHHGCNTTCTYERIFEHVIPSTTPSRKKFTVQVVADFIEPVPDGTRGNPLAQHEFAKHTTPHHTCSIKSDGWFVLSQLCPAMVQNDHYVHMLGACSSSRILAALDTIVVKELITYHTTNHDTDTQQVFTFHDGVSKESISKLLIGKRFHVKLRILSPYSNLRMRNFT